jgi:hypothetical protein
MPHYSVELPSVGLIVTIEALIHNCKPAADANSPTPESFTNPTSAKIGWGRHMCTSPACLSADSPHTHLLEWLK